jgi:hypothetical protein
MRPIAAIGGGAPLHGGHTMNRVVRCLIAAPAVLVALLLAGPAAADRPHVPVTADPVVLPKLDPATGSGYCVGFDARITFEDLNQYIISETTEGGVTILHITGRARATVTNLSTNESVSFNISGPGTLRLNADGSFSGDLAGPNLLWTNKSDLVLFPDVPTISYTTGHVTFSAIPFGDGFRTISYSLAGGSRQTDVCAVLA